jgi:hypothetical protein
MWFTVVTVGRASAVVAVAGGALLVGPESAGRWIGLVAAVLVGAAVIATRPWVERLADRVAFGPAGDPYSQLSGFVRRISDTLAVDDVMPRVAQTVAQASRTSGSEVQLELGDGTVRRAAWPAVSPGRVTDLEVPLQHRGEHVGALGVVADSATPVDSTRALLDRLAGTAGLALANVRLAFELRREIEESRHLAERLHRSRQRLLDAAASQTRRFSVLVDERVQSRLRAAADALDRAEGGHRSALDDAASEAAAALQALRDLSAGVFPATLVDNGPRVALETYASRFDGRVLVRQNGSSARFPGPIEAAAYLCVVQVVDDCAARGGGVLVVMEQAASSLRFLIRSDRPPSSETVELVADRVEATDGLLERRPDDGVPVHGRPEVVFSWTRNAARAPSDVRS